ncbi:MAG: hypothetical protein ACOY7P_19125 [Pseudomonadota bacterium]
MARYVIQSAETFCFLHSSPRTGDVSWTPSLLTAIRHGIVHEADEVAQLIEDHCDRHAAIVIDLDIETD